MKKLVFECCKENENFRLCRKLKKKMSNVKKIEKKKSKQINKDE